MKILITGGSGFIGTNMVEHYTELGWAVLNIDIRPPQVEAQRQYWVEADLRNREQMVEVVGKFKPDYVINLAAATGAHIKGLNEEYFAANTRGVDNLLHAMDLCGGVKRAIFTSSLLVCENGYIPKNDTDYCAPNPYGISKVKGEQIVRADKTLDGQWIIVRPSSVWGPWFVAYLPFFKLVARSLYFTIGGTENLVKPVVYVGNVARMFDKMLAAEPEQVNGKTFYLVDYPGMTTPQWAEAIRKQTGARRIPVVPYGIAKLMALCGDVLKALGWKDVVFSSFRLHNMMTGGDYPTAALQELVGPLPYSTDGGVRATTDWMRAQGILKK